MKYNIITESVTLKERVLEVTLNALIRVVYPFTVGMLVLYNWLWFFALIPSFLLFRLWFSFEREQEVEQGGVKMCDYAELNIQDLAKMIKELETKIAQYEAHITSLLATRGDFS